MDREESFGGYPLFCIYTYTESKVTLYKANLRSDKALALAQSVWKNNQPLNCVKVINQRTSLTRDTISRHSKRPVSDFDDNNAS